MLLVWCFAPHTLWTNALICVFFRAQARAEALAEAQRERRRLLKLNKGIERVEVEKLLQARREAKIASVAAEVCLRRLALCENCSPCIFLNRCDARPP